MSDRVTAEARELTPEQFGSSFKAFMDAVLQATSPPANPLLDRIQDHLGAETEDLAVVTEEFDNFEHPNVQVALNSLLSSPGRDSSLIGVSSEHKFHMSLGLSDLLSRSGGMGRPPLTVGPVDYVNFHLANDEVLPCVQFGLLLVRTEDTRQVLFIAGPVPFGPPNQKVRVEATAREPAAAHALLAELREEANRRNVYKGHVISLSPGDFHMGPQTLVAFHTLPEVQRDDVVLPGGLLERIERQTIVFSNYADRLKAAGRALKRGILLYGPPGTGKTFTVMYLAGQMPGRTVLLTTGLGMGLLRPVMQMARLLAPTLVVLEDVDLIAEERGNPWSRGGTLLFELLNELDGLRDDCDVIFLMTTNRPEVLEPALADRPGRVDLAVELPLPDEDGRRKLFELYARGLDVRGVDFAPIIDRTSGASPAFIKELLRKAALLAAGRDREILISQDDLDQALVELTSGKDLTKRILGFGGERDSTSYPRPESRTFGPL
jgi:AAA+ superfamily predicted ATPase